MTLKDEIAIDISLDRLRNNNCSQAILRWQSPQIISLAAVSYGKLCNLSQHLMNKRATCEIPRVSKLIMQKKCLIVIVGRSELKKFNLPIGLQVNAEAAKSKALGACSVIHVSQ